ncbi:MAG TPA: hypothetical protein DEB40_00785 [Elusimicrobia bacterium]|nr:hypothetical protein [Elusimicrobiota bacterium]HBT60264.1 hypothetical protein [Elusimicrobiota bacterium]
MSMNEKVEVEIARRRFTVEIDDLTPMEIVSIANNVNEKHDQVQALYPKIADSSKLAIITAFYMAVDLYQMQQAEKTNQDALENTLESVVNTLQQTLAAAGPLPEAKSE